MPRPVRSLTALVLGAVLSVPLSTVVVAPAHADHAQLPDDRRLVPYVVRPGDTASSLAVRFHAWTAELVAYNHLGRDGTLRVGERIVIPVVRKDRGKDGGARTGARAAARTTGRDGPRRCGSTPTATARRCAG